MKIIRDENDKDIILEVVFAENEDPVKCLEVFREIEKNRIDADKAKCEMSHETNRHNMTMQADVFKHQMTMTALMPMIDANMKAVNPTELASKIVDDEFKDIELTATDEDNITDKAKR